MLKTMLALFLAIVMPMSGFSENPRKVKRKYHLSVCTIFNDEAPYLKEWIEYHEMLGVEHFYLYNFFSEDNYLEVLAPYINSGLVELKDWGYVFNNWEEWKGIQVACYNDCIKNSKFQTEWLAFIDADEFVFPVKDYTIPEALQRYDEYAGVVINWQLYGSSDYYKLPLNMLMTEVLIKRAEIDYEENQQYKTIIRPKYVKEAKSAHYFVFKNGYKAVNTSFKPLEQIRISDYKLTTILVDLLRIIHYWTRDLYFFHEVKLARQKRMGKNINASLTRASCLNKVTDFCMEKYVEPLRERVLATKSDKSD